MLWLDPRKNSGSRVRLCVGHALHVAHDAEKKNPRISTIQLPVLIDANGTAPAAPEAGCALIIIDSVPARRER